jgi:hypothetical protein
MIINKYVELKVSRKNIDHFKQWYKDIKLKDIIKVDPEKLQKSSSIRLDVSCDICGIERNIKYQAYSKNINSCENYPIYTCDKCSHVKIKEYNKKKWGVEYYSQTKEYSEKFKSTMLERFGVEYALQSQQLKEKAKKTNLKKFGYENPFMDSDRIKKIFNEKYGVNHPSQVKEFYEKIEKSNLEKFGYKSPLSSPIIRENYKKINLDKWGEEHYSKTDDFREKIKKTNLDKWGVEWSLQNKEIREKIKKTNLERWGVENPILSDESRKRFKITNEPNYISYEGSGISKLLCNKEHIYMINNSNYSSRKKNNIPLCTVCNPISDSKSIKEKELFQYIQSIYNGKIIQSYRDGLEIDIYLPDLKLGFEFNGLYWHSEEWKKKNYHLEKTNYFKEKGIKIIHIWEDNWDYKRDIIESQIKNWLFLTERKIFARNCKVVEIKDSKIATNFLEENHIQGKVRSSLKLGLYYNDELVSLMTFDNFEGRKKMENGGWNLSRFCNKLNTNVVGGSSKLLQYFIRNFKPSRVISYADRDWSQGDLYYKLGFNKVSESKPDYKYLVDNKRVHKSRFRKSRLNTNLTESQEMKKSQIQRIWDCGKIKFELI